MATGIKETQEMLRFVLALGNAAGKSMADGKISWLDAVHFWDAFRSANDAFLGANLILKELKDLDATEKATLYTQLETEFDIPHDEIEARVEKALKAAITLAALIADYLPVSKPPLQAA